MRFAEAECRRRLRHADHGVLGTVHPDRGVDAVPVVFVVHDGELVIPVDTVKPKGGARLQRLVNLEQDPRCTLLVEHYEADWSRLWWVRVHGEAHEVAPDEVRRRALGERYPAYREPGSVVGVLVLVPAEITGWSAR